MKYQNLVCGVTIGILLSGCTTMQMLGESKDEIKKGNYGWGAFMGTYSLVFGPVIDVFTLGGTLDSPEKVNQAYSTVGTAYNSYAASTGKPQVNIPPIGNVSSESGNNTSSRSNYDIKDDKQPVSPVNQCIKFGKKSKYTATMSNSCAYPVRVSYCYTNIRGASEFFDVHSDECKIKTYPSYTIGEPMPAHGTRDVSHPGNDTGIYVIACRALNNESVSSGPDHVKWNGSSYVGVCYPPSTTVKMSTGSKQSGGVK